MTSKLGRRRQHRDEETRINSEYKVHSWLENAELHSLKNEVDKQKPLPIEIVEEAVFNIELKAKVQRENKPEPFNIFHQLDDNYDFSTKLKHSSDDVNKVTHVKKHAVEKPTVEKKSSVVLDSFNDQKKLFELDDYIHEDDSNPNTSPIVYKSQPIKVSDAISRLRPPALEPFVNKRNKKKYEYVEAKVQTSRKGKPFNPLNWQRISPPDAKVLYQARVVDVAAKEEEVGGKSKVEFFNPNVFIHHDPPPTGLQSKSHTETKKRKEVKDFSKQKRFEFAFTESEVQRLVEEKLSDPQTLIQAGRQPKKKLNFVEYLQLRAKKPHGPLDPVKGVTQDERFFDQIRERMLKEGAATVVLSNLNGKKGEGVKEINQAKNPMGIVLGFGNTKSVKVTVAGKQDSGGGSEPSPSKLTEAAKPKPRDSLAKKEMSMQKPKGKKEEGAASKPEPLNKIERKKKRNKSVRFSVPEEEGAKLKAVTVQMEQRPTSRDRRPSLGPRLKPQKLRLAAGIPKINLAVQKPSEIKKFPELPPYKVKNSGVKGGVELDMYNLPRYPRIPAENPMKFSPYPEDEIMNFLPRKPKVYYQQTLRVQSPDVVLPSPIVDKRLNSDVAKPRPTSGLKRADPYQRISLGQRSNSKKRDASQIAPLTGPRLNPQSTGRQRPHFMNRTEVHQHLENIAKQLKTII